MKEEKLSIPSKEEKKKARLARRGMLLQFSTHKHMHTARFVLFVHACLVSGLSVCCGTDERWASIGTEKKKPRGRPFPQRKSVSASDVPASAFVVPALDVYAADDENMPPHFRVTRPIMGEVVQPYSDFPAGLPVGIVVAQL